MDNDRFEELKIIVYNEIANASKEYPIKGKRLCNNLNLPFRVVKKIITSLREEYPIVSKETNGGGYWLATSQSDILQFIKMINARKIGYEETIDKMKKFLDDKNYENHIPYID